jgi:hypothetical protein
MLNREIIPPDADMRYESFLDKAKQDTASSVLGPVSSLLMSCRPLFGCHNRGGTLVVAYIQYLITMKLSTSRFNFQTKQKLQMAYELLTVSLLPCHLN